MDTERHASGQRTVRESYKQVAVQSRDRSVRPESGSEDATGGGSNGDRREGDQSVGRSEAESSVSQSSL